MATPVIALVTLLVLIVGTIWTGRAILALLRIGPLLGQALENYFLAAFVGTACWGLVVAWSSYLGLAALPATGVLLGVLLILALSVRVTGRARNLLARPQTPYGPAIFAIFAFAAFYCIGEVLIWGNFIVYNDAFSYILSCEWLQQHGFYEQPPYNPRQPITMEILVFQVAGVRMGGTFILALCQALSFVCRGIDVYPGVLAFGVLLNLAGVYLVVRWCLRLSHFYALIGLMLAGLLTNPFLFSAGGGFLHQGYGTAFLSCGIAILARALPSWNHHVRMAILVALIHAGLILYYSEMLPFLLVADGLFSVMVLRTYLARNDFKMGIWYLGCIIAAVLVLVNHEFYRVYLAFQLQTKALVGWQIPFDAFRYVAFGLGILEYGELASSRFRMIFFVYCIPLILFFGTYLVLGAIRSTQSKLTMLLLGPLVLLAALLTYYSLAVTDPMQNVPGHRWNLFKLCKYGYPLVLCTQVLGIWVVFRNHPARQKLVLGLVVGLCLIHLPIHIRCTSQRNKSCCRLMNSTQPFADMRQIREFIQREKPSHIIVSSDIAIREAVLLYAIAPVEPLGIHDGSWRGYTAKVSTIPTGIHADRILLIGGFETTASERLTAGWIDQDRPTILRILNSELAIHNAGNGAVDLANHPVVFDVYDPTGGNRVLSFQAKARGTWHPGGYSLRFTSPYGSVTTITLGEPTEQGFQIPVQLPPGTSKFTLECSEPMPIDERLIPEDRYHLRFSSIRLHSQP